MPNAVENSEDDLPRLTVAGNELKLVRSANERMTSVIDIIRQAKRSVQIFMYMFEEDATGISVLDALVDAARRGVDVELIVDSFGSNGASANFFDPLIDAGGRFSIFSPRFSTSYFVRNHQKIIIADKKRAIVGGFNIADQYFNQHAKDGLKEENPNSWEDLGLLINGPEVTKLSDYFQQLSDWVVKKNGNMRSLRKMIKRWKSGDGQFQWLIGGPSNRLSSWAWSIKNNLQQGHSLDLVSAYFSPGQGLLRRIALGSKQGNLGRLILPGRTDNAATIGASRLLYGYLLKRGVKIYEYQPKRLHMKMVVVGDAVYIGSANFDLRSLYINVEIMLRIEDKAFAEQARTVVDGLIEHSEMITRETHKSRKGPLNHLRWLISYLVVNALDYSVTRRINFGVKK